MQPQLDVCLAVPPFHTLHYPPLGAPVLKTALLARGLTAQVVYGGFSLAARSGFEPYDRVCRAVKHPKLGERLYRSSAYPPETLVRMAEPEPLSARCQAMYDGLVDFIAPALDALVDEILALRPRILGISSSFEQNLASAALARRVRAAAPEVCIVLGGPNVAWPMARGLAEVFPWVDYFFSGEADVDFPDFCVRLIRQGERPAARILCSQPIRDMRTVFPPDFSEFFAALRPLQDAAVLPEWLPRYLMLESSRGCWWGARHHCTFCGLNGEGMGFREKPAETVLTEVAMLARWGVHRVRMTDNIMPRRYLQDLLPSLAQAEPHTKLFYEVKANLDDDELDVMAAGGLAKIQAGIESLSTSVLALMRKGLTAHQNIALLRSCGAIGMLVVWNILYGFPGETAEDYEATIALIPRLTHLQPPGSVQPIMIDRYSPFFNEPEAMGIGPIQPFPAYRALYPPEARLEDIAYHFEASYTTGLIGNQDLMDRLHAAVESWDQAWKKGRHPLLQVMMIATGAVVIDTRPIARQVLTPLTVEQLAALIHLERARPRARLDPALQASADWLLARDFVVEHEDKLLSVVVRPRPEAAAAVARAAGSAAAVPSRPDSRWSKDRQEAR
ncbi:MAG: RiPP maturation radical SAM C-methyltransferase [Vicinamibacteria bacterium]|nr:RiPP maturation radical SAM C-methyltransferase [Vicinamibacteria bacterium]